MEQRLTYAHSHLLRLKEEAALFREIAVGKKDDALAI